MFTTLDVRTPGRGEKTAGGSDTGEDERFEERVRVDMRDVNRDCSLCADARALLAMYMSGMIF
jgi:hypothetical protein